MAKRAKRQASNRSAPARKPRRRKLQRAEARDHAEDTTLDALPFGEFAVDPAGAAETGLSLHDLFQQQTMAMIDRADLSEEQKQSILVAMNCPCCGGSGLSFTMKLKRRT